MLVFSLLLIASALMVAFAADLTVILLARVLLGMAISNSEKTSMTMRRSMRRVTLPVTRLVNSATSAVMVTVCPA